MLPIGISLSWRGWTAVAVALVVAACGGEKSPTQASAPAAAKSAVTSPDQPNNQILFATVSAGWFRTCGITTENAAAYCWGYNSLGQLGDGTTTDSKSPVAVAGGLHFAAVSAGDFHSCGVTTAGEAYCWGDNWKGELGDGTTTDRASPVAVLGGLHFATVSAGYHLSCGLTTAGEAYCWGYNRFGELGDGTTTDRTSPVPVLGGLSFAAVSAGGHSCGVTTTAAAYCWGGNFYGQLGDGTTTTRLSPVAVLGGLSFAAVSTAAGSGHTCGVTAGGAAYCWGSNSWGQLGDGTTTPRSSPGAVPGGLSFAAVSAGSSYTCGVVTEDDAAYCWGNNSDGQLGDGTTTDRMSPVAVVGGLRFATVSASLAHTCGVTIEHYAAYCWGRNASGQLGDGTTTPRSSPVQVVP